jgi:hypothetical protein
MQKSNQVMLVGSFILVRSPRGLFPLFVGSLRRVKLQQTQTCFFTRHESGLSTHQQQATENFTLQAPSHTFKSPSSPSVLRFHARHPLTMSDKSSIPSNPIMVALAPVVQFSEDAKRLVKKCTKPDPKGERVAVCFKARLRTRVCVCVCVCGVYVCLSLCMYMYRILSIYLYLSVHCTHPQSSRRLHSPHPLAS